MTERQKQYARQYYRKRREQVRAAGIDPSKHPLRIWRKTHGMSLADAALLLGVSDSQVWQWEQSLCPLPDWLQDILDEEPTDYMQKKIKDLLVQRKQQMRNHPLRQWRRRLHISQAQAAALLGIPKSTLASWEQLRRDPPEWVLARTEEIKCL